MVDYRIVCTVQVPPHTSGHIIKVGTNPSLDRYSKLWTVPEVLAAIRAGHTFHTLSPSTGERANVEIYPCPAHGEDHIRSTPDAVTDNNLDSLNSCKI